MPKKRGKRRGKIFQEIDDHKLELNILFRLVTITKLNSNIYPFPPANSYYFNQLQHFQCWYNKQPREAPTQKILITKQTKLTKLCPWSSCPAQTCKLHVDFQLKNHEQNAPSHKQLEFQPTHAVPAEYNYIYIKDKQLIDQFLCILSILDA